MKNSIYLWRPRRSKAWQSVLQTGLNQSQDRANGTFPCGFSPQLLNRKKSTSEFLLQGGRAGEGVPE